MKIKSKFKAPANVDPIRLADEIKKGLSENWLKRREILRKRI